MKQLTLGEFIEALEQLERANGEENKYISFDFCMLSPTTFNSYRGYYEQSALGHSDSGGPTLVSELLALAKAEIGQVRQGWKGGHYRMDSDTLLWADNPGRYSETKIVGVKNIGYWNYILTEVEDL